MKVSKSTVEAESFISGGILDLSKIHNVTSKGGKVLGLIQKFLDGLVDHPAIYRIELADNETSIYMQMLPAKNPPENYEVPTDNDTDKNQLDYNRKTKPKGQYVDITIEYVDPDTKERKYVEQYPNVEFEGDQIEKKIKEWLTSHSNEKEIKTDSYYRIYEVKSTSEKNAAASTSLSMKLRKVMSADSMDIQLVSVMCNYEPIKALEDIDILLDDPEVIAMIPDDGEQSFEVIPEDDELNIEVSDDLYVDTSSLDIFLAALRPMYCAYNNIVTMRVNAKGSQSELLRNQCSVIEWNIRDMLDNLRELCVQFVGYCPNLMSICDNECSVLNFESGVDYDSAVDLIKSNILEVVSALDLYYCDMPHEIQSLYDGWLLTLERDVNYMTRAEML